MSGASEVNWTISANLFWPTWFNQYYLVDFELWNFFAPFFCRCFASQAKSKAAEDRKPLATNQSFVHNLFRGQVESSQVFPYPIALDQEQIEYVSAFVDPVSKFFVEVNDPMKNDANAVMKRLGRFSRSFF